MGVAVRTVRFECPALANEQGGRMLWLLAWLVDDDGTEGPWFYLGRGGEHGEVAVPENAIGVRAYRWVSEGLDPEYADIDLDGSGELRIDHAAFDRAQRRSRLAEAMRPYLSEG